VEPIFDLFGQPIPEGRGKRGRPEHVASVENRNKVSMLLALGWANPRIANALGISLPTLRKNYFHELRYRETARDRLEARRLEMAWKMAEGGNVGAFKEFGKLMDRNDQMLAERSFTEQPTDNQAAPKVGKKEAAAQAAESAGEGSEWGDDLRIPGIMN
jgi:hypothetical protein